MVTRGTLVRGCSIVALLVLMGVQHSWHQSQMHTLRGLVELHVKTPEDRTWPNGGKSALSDLKLVSNHLTMDDNKITSVNSSVADLSDEVVDLEKAIAVPLANGWRAWGGPFGSPTYSVQGGTCIVNGLVKNGGWGHIANLPSQCRPTKLLIFNLNNNAKTARVDVATNGKVSWMGGGRDGWISLTGIIIPTSGGNAVPLANGWQAYGGAFGSPTYSVQGGTCIVNGLVKNGGWGQIANLPSQCRPTKRLVFNLNNHATTARVDVFPHGQIFWVAGGRDYGWISLTGVVFATSTQAPTPAPTPAAGDCFHTDAWRVPTTWCCHGSILAYTATISGYKERVGKIGCCKKGASHCVEACLLQRDQTPECFVPTDHHHLAPPPRGASFHVTAVVARTYSHMPTYILAAAFGGILCGTAVLALRQCMGGPSQQIQEKLLG